MEYKIKDDVDLFDVLRKYRFDYIGNYYRGDNWSKVVDGIDTDKPRNGVVIHGDWDNRRITFKFTYRGTTENLDILKFIPELVEDDLIEEVSTNE